MDAKLVVVVAHSVGCSNGMCAIYVVFGFYASESLSSWSGDVAWRNYVWIVFAVLNHGYLWHEILFRKKQGQTNCLFSVGLDYGVYLLADRSVRVCAYDNAYRCFADGPNDTVYYITDNVIFDWLQQRTGCREQQDWLVPYIHSYTKNVV